MSKLRISDLSFCEIEVISVLVRGGSGTSLSINGLYGIASAQATSNFSRGYNASYSVNPNGYSAYIVATYDGAAAGAAAGAAGNGDKFAYASATASEVN